jgi:hypothetical protein
MRNRLQMNPWTFILTRGQVFSLQRTGTRCRISCVAGRLWVTASGCSEDSVLGPGDEAPFTGRGRIVVEALRTATVRLEIGAEATVQESAPFPLGTLPVGLLP